VQEIHRARESTAMETKMPITMATLSFALVM
jgi:hypothetical protein